MIQDGDRTPLPILTATTADTDARAASTRKSASLTDLQALAGLGAVEGGKLVGVYEAADRTGSEASA